MWNSIDKGLTMNLHFRLNHSSFVTSDRRKKALTEQISDNALSDEQKPHRVIKINLNKKQPV